MRYWIGCILLMLAVTSAQASDREIRLAVTTSFQNSGLSDILLPEFTSDTGIEVELLVVGTGQALKLGEFGDVDAVLVHSRQDEEAFVANRFATHRREIMYNDFVVVGPDDDPAGIKVATSVSEAFAQILKTESTFISRGDDSGTHKRERVIWKGIIGQTNDQMGPAWYKSIGAGMGAALNFTSAVNGYCLTDRSSWLNFQNKGELKILFQGDPGLRNQYAFLPINPERHPHVDGILVKELEEWLAGDRGQGLIAGYKIGGETVFTPNAIKQN